MKHVESPWKPLEQKRSQVHEGKKWLLPNDKTNRLAEDNLSVRR
jgi:hypothetical protein